MKKALCYKMDQEVFKRLTFLAKVNNLSKTAQLTTLINKNFKMVKSIYGDVVNHTHFTSTLEGWDITNMARKYNLSGKDICYGMIKDAKPFEAGKMSHNPNIKLDFEETNCVEKALWTNNLDIALQIIKCDPDNKINIINTRLTLLQCIKKFITYLFSTLQVMLIPIINIMLTRKIL